MGILELSLNSLWGFTTPFVSSGTHFGSQALEGRYRASIFSNALQIDYQYINASAFNKTYQKPSNEIHRSNPLHPQSTEQVANMFLEIPPSIQHTHKETSIEVFALSLLNFHDLECIPDEFVMHYHSNLRRRYEGNLDRDF